MLSEALIDDDQRTSDLVVYVIVFLIAVSLCAYVGHFVSGGYGPFVLVPSMIVGFCAVAFAASRIAKRRDARDARKRAIREAVAEAELKRKIKYMKRDRFEKGL